MLSTYRDTFAGLAVLAFAAAVFLIGGSYQPATSFFPRSVAVIMGLCGAALAVRGMVSPTTGEPMPADLRRRVALAIGLTLAYVAGVRFLGYATASLVFIPATAWLLGVRDIKLIVLVTAIFVGVVTYFFRSVFHIPLPAEAVLLLFR